MNACLDHQKELADCAGELRQPNAALARHLQSCPQCQAVFAELQAVAGAHCRAANALAQPAPGGDLGSWFLRQQIPRGQPGEASMPRIRFALALAGAVALAVFLSAIAIVLNSRETHSPAAVATAHPEGSKQPFDTEDHLAAGAAPTWNALREELKSDQFPIELPPPSTALRTAQYRVKDAYSLAD